VTAWPGFADKSTLLSIGRAGSTTVYSRRCLETLRVVGEHRSTAVHRYGRAGDEARIVGQQIDNGRRYFGGPRDPAERMDAGHLGFDVRDPSRVVPGQERPAG
jgi:hypothetical protein